MKSILFRFFVFFLVAAVVIFCAPSAEKNSVFVPVAKAAISPGDSDHTLNVDNMERSYRLHVPPGFSPSEPAALVFVFHGFSENGQSISEVTGMSDIADAGGFLVVYPDGTVLPGPLSWNAGGCCGYAAENQIDEPAFIRAILAELGQILSVDPKRVYAAGFSNGALLAYRLACEMADTFAAVAPVAGLLPISVCQPQEPISIIHIHGSGDVAVPIGGGGINPSSGLPFLSVNRVIAAWVRLDGCVDSPQRDQDGIVAHTTFSECRNGTAVELYMIRGMGHLWPPASVFPASQIIWDFFAAHPKH